MDVSRSVRRTRKLPWGIVMLLVMWLGGLLLGHFPMLLTGLERVQGDVGDTRFVNYVLEHTYRWAARWPQHESLWIPPFFYPVANVLAYSETFLGTGPLYWLWRFLKVSPDTSYQLWMLCVSSLNFWVAYPLLRRLLKVARFPACAGAVLFAFGAPRMNQIGHPQLLQHAMTLVAVYAIVRLLGESTPRRLLGWAGILCASLVGQIYASVYLGWFLVLGLGLAVAWSMAVARWRRSLLAALRRLPLAPALGIAAACFLLLVPIAVHYSAAAAELGMRSTADVASFQPRPGSWLSPGPRSWLYGSTVQRWEPLDVHPERQLGLGLVTTVLCLWGLWLGRRNNLVALSAVTAITAIGISTIFFEQWSLWWLIYRYVPAAGALRAVSRLGLCMLLPAALCLSLALDRIWSRRWAWAAIPLALLCAAEQGLSPYAFSKAENRLEISRVASRLDPECDVFLYSRYQGRWPSWKYHLDAMWAQLQTGIPTVNGHSGNLPPGWPFVEVSIQDELQQHAVKRALADWTWSQGLDGKEVCWAQAYQVGTDDAVFLGVTVPPQITAGQEVSVSLTVRNAGQSVWSREALYRLGLQVPRDSATWRTTRVELPATPVPPGQQARFEFRVRAPSRPGTYPFRWRMVREGMHWFGEFSESVQVNVREANRDAQDRRPR